MNQTIKPAQTPLIGLRIFGALALGVVVASLLSVGALQAKTGDNATQKPRMASCCGGMAVGAAAPQQKAAKCNMGNMGAMTNMSHTGHAKAAPKKQ